MISRRFFLRFGALAAVLGLLAWLIMSPGGTAKPTQAASLKPVTFRLGLIPDRNLYDQRKAYRALADYLEAHIHISRGISTLDAEPPVHVDLVTSSNYAGVLQDFSQGDVDGAFLGSLVAVLAVDRCGAQVLAKSENQQSMDTYAGVLFVPEKSPIKSLADLKAKKLGTVRTTMAGAIYPLWAFQQAAISAADGPEFIWSGTHDDVIEEVIAGRVDAGAVKDLRLNAYELEHSGVAFRRLATGPRAPDNAFVTSRKLSPEMRDAVLSALLAMQANPDARPALEKLKLNRFVRCDLAEYRDLYGMIDALGPRWTATGIGGSAPRPPGGTTHAAP